MNPSAILLSLLQHGLMVMFGLVAVFLLSGAASAHAFVDDCVPPESITAGMGECGGLGYNIYAGPPIGASGPNDWLARTGQGMCLEVLQIGSDVLMGGQYAGTVCGDLEFDPPPVDCQVSDWSGWDSCSVTCGGGTQTRTRTITTQPENGGALCPALSQDQACNTQACTPPPQPEPQCTPTWSPDPSTVCSGVSFTQNDGCGGTRTVTGTKTDGICAPPAPVNCQGSWGGGSCSATCGGGTRTETYTITQPAVGTGLACEAANGATRSVPCNTQACPLNVDCAGTWSNWGQCSNGQQTRTFTVTTPPQGTGAACPASPQSQSCTSNVDCAGTWSNWGQCSNGQQTRTFTVTTPPQGTGAACPASPQSQSCTSNVDCAGTWSNWGQCSNGQQTRTFTVTTPPQGTGAACPASPQSQSCTPTCTPTWSPDPSTVCSGVSFTQNDGCGGTRTVTGTKTDGICAPPAPVNCQGSWGGGSCSATCGGGTRTETYTITQPAVGTGLACEAANGATRSVPCNTQACVPTQPPACIPGWFPTDNLANYCTYESVWVNDGCGGGFATPGTQDCGSPTSLVTDLKVNNSDGQATVFLGQDFTLSWQTENGSCQLFGDGISRTNRPNTNAPGSLTLPVSAVGTQAGDFETYLLQCQHTQTGQIAQDTVLVVIGTSNPNLTFSAARATASPLNPATGTYDTVTVEFVARNDSNTPINQSSQYEVQTRAGNRTGSLDPIPAQRDHSVQTVTFTNVSPGSFSVTVRLDSQGDITETNEGDNESTFDATIPPLNPGLALTVTPERVQNGQSAIVRWTAATPYAMNCSLFGPAMTTRNFDLTSPSLADNNITVGPLSAKSEYTLRCDAAGVIFTATDIVETQGVMEEI